MHCSPRLSAFIIGHTNYSHRADGPPDPKKALRALLRRCFVGGQWMWTLDYSLEKLFIHSHMILDMAFVRAVRVASAWLGPDAMPVGYIDTWPPQHDDAGL